MKAGLSTACMYPYQLKDALTQLVSRGVSVFELFINTWSELETNYILSVKNILDEYKAQIVSVHPFTCDLESLMFFSQYDGRFEESLDLYKKYFNAAAELGASIVVLHGISMFASMGWEQSYERYAGLYRAAAGFGVTLANENIFRHGRHNHDYLVGMKDYLGDECAFVLDIKQTVRSGVELFDFMQKAGSSIAHIHYSESLPDNNCLMFGRGDLDRVRFRDTLCDIGYDGAIIMELYGGADAADADTLKTNCDQLEAFYVDGIG